MDAEKGGLAVAFDRNFRLSETLCDILDQVAHRAFDRALISLAVGLEPFPALVKLERLEERQRLWAEACERHRSPGPPQTVTGAARIPAKPNTRR